MNYKHLIFISIIFFFTSCTTNKYLAPVVNKNESYMNKNSISRTINVYAGDSLYAISKSNVIKITFSSTSHSSIKTSSYFC